MNVPLLNEIKERIRKEPELFYMADYIRPSMKVGEVCGTACCIAGHAIIIDHKGNEDAAFEVVKDRPFSSGAKVLGLSEAEADALFLMHSWPEPFRSEQLRLDRNVMDLEFDYSLNRGDREQIQKKIHELSVNRAENACARIDYFIKKGI